MEFKVPEKKGAVSSDEITAKMNLAAANAKKKASSTKKKKNADGETEDSDAMEDVKGKISDDENKPKKPIRSKSSAKKKLLSSDGKF